MPYTVAQAAKAIGKSKATVFRAITKGTISAARDEATGAFLIDPSELHRAFPHPAEVSHEALQETGDGVPRNGEWHDLKARLELTELRLADTQDQVADLRHRLDQADTDRRQALDRLAAAQERIAALLTDQRPVPARRWWRWGRKLIGAMLVVACGGPALAAPLGSDELLENCLEPRGTYGAGYCLGYASGVIEAIGSSEVCVPEGTKHGQVRDVVVRYLQAHPEVRHYAAIDVVGVALRDAFPCRR